MTIDRNNSNTDYSPEQFQTNNPLEASENSESSIDNQPDLLEQDHQGIIDSGQTELPVTLPGSAPKKRRQRASKEAGNSDCSQVPDAEANQLKPGTADVVPPLEPKDDPFAPGNLKLSQEFESLTPTRQLRTVVKVGKPSKEAFVRVSTDLANWVDAFVIELKEPREDLYWVVPALSEALRSERCFKRVKFALAVDRYGTPFIWKIALPNSDGRKEPWVDSMIQIAELAKAEWVRVYWSDETRAYEARIAEGVSEPRWPTESMSELLRIAFKGRVIDSLDHTVLKSLNGRD